MEASDALHTVVLLMECYHTMCFTLETILHQAAAAAYIDHVVGSPSTNQVVLTGRGGSLGWRQSANANPKILDSTPSMARKKNKRGKQGKKSKKEKEKERKREKK